MATEVRELSLKWVSDEDAIRTIQAEVESEVLFDRLNDQLERLEKVDAKQSGKVRRQQARDAGCLCAVAKGAAQRELKPDLIFIPNSELTITSGKVRVTALKATLPIPDGVHVKNVTFVRELGNWRAVLEVKEEVCVS